MEFTVYPIANVSLPSKKDTDIERLDLKESDDEDLGALMFEIPVNNQKGYIKLYFTHGEALMLAKNIELFLSLKQHTQ